jgi:hypothetical protein
VLTVENIWGKNYTPRDLWETLELCTQLRGAIERHQVATTEATEADKKLWEILDRGGLHSIIKQV